QVDTTGNPIAHRLILAFAPHRNVADSASPFEQCRAAIQAQMDRASLTPAAGVIRDLEPLLPHAESVLAGSRIRPEDVSRLAGSLGMHYQALGRYSGAKRLLREALASDEKKFKPGHPSLATRQSNLAALLRNRGQLEEARDLL